MHDAETDRDLVKGATRDTQSVAADWTPHDRELIEGVEVIEIRPVLKRAGALTEIFRDDWTGNSTVAHVFQLSLAPGAVSGWHAHRRTTDRVFVAAGGITLALYDGRPASPTARCVNEFHLSIARPQLIVIPPRVWHGLVVADADPALVLNLTDRVYVYENPDHWRLPADSPEIPYSLRQVTEALT